MTMIYCILIVQIQRLATSYCAPTDEGQMWQPIDQIEACNSNDQMSFGSGTQDGEVDVERYMPPMTYKPRKMFSTESSTTYEMRIFGARQRYEETRRQLRKKLVKVAKANRDPLRLDAEMLAAINEIKSKKSKLKKAYQPELEGLGVELKDYRELNDDDPEKKKIEKHVRTRRNWNNKLTRYKRKYLAATTMEEKEMVLEQAERADIDRFSLLGLGSSKFDQGIHIEPIGGVHEIAPLDDASYRIGNTDAYAPNEDIPSDWLSLAPPHRELNDEMDWLRSGHNQEQDYYDIQGDGQEDSSYADNTHSLILSLSREHNMFS